MYGRASSGELPPVPSSAIPVMFLTYVKPLDVGQAWSDREAPETFPSGI